MSLYVLNPGTGLPVAIEDSQSWSLWMEANRSVLEMRTRIGRMEVVTQFVGFDQANGQLSDPLVFETTVKGWRNETYFRRSCTRLDAGDAHADTVRLAYDSAGILDLLIEMVRKVFGK